MGMFRNLFDSPVHLLILLLVIVIVFGWKKLPDAARSVGRSMRIFKAEVEEMKGEDKGRRSAASSDTVNGDVVDDEQRASRQEPTHPAPSSAPPQPDPNAPDDSTPPASGSSSQQRPSA
ncbi:Sec-independent protein translocase subunit TatA [Segeticoccus rhizosphaerae]|uniref:Sec-independent protein translocase subunit TatA n=1 Tax=Segeticoccus rhizosphaerae TaxID=1104777 RepID=UPI001EF12941|nr:Sec-independent protein translocase subunit TatA [Segeticoccus rhizosphaerae]